MITRKLGKIIRGKITPFQIFLGCFIGVLLGFLPGFSKAPGLYVLLFTFVMILNVNLILCAILVPLSKLLYLLTLPFVFQTGQVISDNLEMLLKPIVNFPVLAWFGFEYYVTIGGIVWGAFLGVMLGLWINKIVKGIRTKLGDLGENSEKYKEFQEKKVVKILTWVFFGGKGKHTYEEVLKSKVGNPIRIMGLVGVVGFFIIGYTVIHLTRNDILKYTLVSHLEKLNGATVDLENVRLSLTHAKLKMEELAFANPKKLDEDRLLLKHFEADFDIEAFLRRSFVIEVIKVGEVFSDQKRKNLGVIVESEVPAVEPTPASSGFFASLGGEYASIDEYFQKYNEITESLKPYEEWGQKIYQQVKSSKKIEEIEANQSVKKEKKQEEETTSLEKMLKDLAKEQGYESIINPRLIVRKPIFQINHLELESIKIPQPVLEGSNVKMKNISSYPASLPEPISLELSNEGRKLYAKISFDSFMYDREFNKIDLKFDHIDGEKVGRELKVQNSFPLKKGDLKLALQGDWAWNMEVALNGVLELKDGIIEYEGNALNVESLLVPLEMRGTLYKPSIKVNGKELAKQISDMAMARVKNELKNEGKKLLNEGKDELQDLLKKGVNKENVESSTQDFLDKQKDKTNSNPLKDLFKK